MIISLFKLVFGKVIGLDKIPPSKRKAAAAMALNLAKKGIEAAAHGASDGATDGMQYKFKKEF